MRRFKGWVLRKFYPDVTDYIIMKVMFSPDEGGKYLLDEYDLYKDS